MKYSIYIYNIIVVVVAVVAVKQCEWYLVKSYVHITFDL